MKLLIRVAAAGVVVSFGLGAGAVPASALGDEGATSTANSSEAVDVTANRLRPRLAVTCLGRVDYTHWSRSGRSVDFKWSGTCTGDYPGAVVMLV